MALITSGTAKGHRCPICGSPDGTCGGAHAQDAAAVDASLYAPAAPRPGAVDVVVRKPINGTMATVLGNAEEAEREGWEIVSALGGKPYHKKRPAPEPIKPEAPEPVEPEPATEGDEDPEAARRAILEAKTKADVYDIAATLDVAGRSSMDKDQLIAAVLAYEVSP